MTWTVNLSSEFEAWFDGLDVKSQDAILTDLAVLRDMGPQLGRPHVDTLKGSRHSNMKELRTAHRGHQYRIAFAFDPKRAAIVIVGGDKTGADQKRFYRDLITNADAIFDHHLAALKKRDRHA